MCNSGAQRPHDGSVKDVAFPLLWVTGSFGVLKGKVAESWGTNGKISGDGSKSQHW